MIRHFTTLITLALFVCFSSTAFAHNRSWPGKRLEEMLPEAKTYSQKQGSLTPPQIAWVEKSLGEPIRAEDRNPLFYVGAAKDGAVVGTVVFIDASGLNGKIEMGLAIDPVGRVIRALLFEHSEGAYVASSAFLGQFRGKKASDKFKIGVDIKAPTEEKKGAQIVATAIRRGLLLAMAALRLGVK